MTIPSTTLAEDLKAALKEHPKQIYTDPKQKKSGAIPIVGSDDAFINKDECSLSIHSVRYFFMKPGKSHKFPNSDFLITFAKRLGSDMNTAAPLIYACFFVLKNEFEVFLVLKNKINSAELSYDLPEYSKYKKLILKSDSYSIVKYFQLFQKEWKEKKSKEFLESEAVNESFQLLQDKFKDSYDYNIILLIWKYTKQLNPDFFGPFNLKVSSENKELENFLIENVTEKKINKYKKLKGAYNEKFRDNLKLSARVYSIRAQIRSIEDIKAVLIEYFEKKKADRNFRIIDIFKESVQKAKSIIDQNDKKESRDEGFESEKQVKYYLKSDTFEQLRGEMSEEELKKLSKDMDDIAAEYNILEDSELPENIKMVYAEILKTTALENYMKYLPKSIPDCLKVTYGADGNLIDFLLTQLKKLDEDMPKPKFSLRTKIKTKELDGFIQLEQKRLDNNKNELVDYINDKIEELTDFYNIESYQSVKIEKDNIIEIESSEIGLYQYLSPILQLDEAICDNS